MASGFLELLRLCEGVFLVGFQTFSGNLYHVLNLHGLTFLMIILCQTLYYTIEYIQGEESLNI